MSLKDIVNGAIRDARKTSLVYDLDGLVPTKRSGMKIDTTSFGGTLTSITLYDELGPDSMRRRPSPTSTLFGN